MTLTTLLSNLNEIVIALANIFVIAMSIFMEPPLIIFVEISIFIVMFAILNKIFLRYNIGRRIFEDSPIILKAGREPSEYYTLFQSEGMGERLNRLSKKK